MALNFPGPQEVRLFYTKAGLAHEARYNVECTTPPAPGTLPANINLVTENVPALNLTTTITSWVALLRPLFSASDVTFDFFELWSYDPVTHLATFICTDTLALAGTNGGAGTQGSQLIFSFRTSEGNNMRLSLMEAAVGTTAVLGYAGLPAAEKAVVDFVLSTDHWMRPRDTSWPRAFIRALYGQNEALFKKRYRP